MDNNQRAHQLWSVLAFAALNRQTMTYGLLGQLVGLPAPATGGPLYPIQYFCKQQELPPLTVLVVNKTTGLPGAGFEVDDFAKRVREVFEFDWLSYKAPGSEVGPDSEDFKKSSRNS